MKKRIIVFIILFLLIIFLLILILQNKFNNQNKVCIKDACFDVEVAQTPEQRAKGLMFRNDLSQDSGVLFIFDNPARHSFWMKNTLISLDIIWINENKEIVFITKNAEPCSNKFCPDIIPDAPANYVLEVNAGISEKFNFSIGDKVGIDLHK